MMIVNCPKCNKEHILLKEFNDLITKGKSRVTCSKCGSEYDIIQGEIMYSTELVEE